MLTPPKPSNIETQLALTKVSLFFTALVFLAFLSALADKFFAWPFWSGVIAGLFWFFNPAGENLRKALKPLFLPAMIIALTVVLWSFFVTPTIFSGRDQGSIAVAAVSLAENHTLSAPSQAAETFFSFYGKGRALNFPGFFYTEEGELITQFPLPYTAYLAAFYALWGLSGLVAANAVLFFFFALNLYLLTKIFATRIGVSERFAYPGLFLVLTAFTPLWFFKFTLTENLAQFLLWSMIAGLIGFLSTGRAIFYVSLFVSGTLLSFTRIEGAVLFALALTTVLARSKTLDILRRQPTKYLFLPLLGASILGGITFARNTDFYRTVIKAFVGSGDFSFSPQSFSWAEFLLPYRDYFSYGILPLLLAGSLGVFYLLRSRKYLLLSPLLIISPIFLYLINPHISSDAPWMLRRLSFALVPAGILYTVSTAAYLYREKFRSVSVIFLAAVFLTVWPSSLAMWSLSEHRTLWRQAQEFYTLFAPDDLILLDKNVTGDNFAMIEGPLRAVLGANTVYFFNPQDLDRVDFSRFENVFLVVPEKELPRYQRGTTRSLIPLAEYVFRTEKLYKPDNKLFGFPHLREVETKNIILRVEDDLTVGTEQPDRD